MKILSALFRLVLRVFLRPLLFLHRPADIHPEVRSMAGLAGYLPGKGSPGQVAAQIWGKSGYLLGKTHVDEVGILAVVWRGPGFRLGVRAFCLIRHLDGGFRCMYDGWPGPQAASIWGAARGITPAGSQILAWAWLRPSGRAEIR